MGDPYLQLGDNIGEIMQPAEPKQNVRRGRGGSGTADCMIVFCAMELMPS